jgi:hypothetical protein
MGTNYYLEFDPCPHCGVAKERKHIGKSSGGWCFALHVYPPEITTLTDWLGEFYKPDTKIINEYGEVISIGGMQSIITHRSWDLGWSEERLKSPPTGFDSWKDFLKANYAEFGPNGLLRHKADGRSHCVGNGKGPWDYIEGDFS